MQKLRQDFVDSCRRKSKRTESERIDNCKQIHERKVRIQRVRKSTSKITHFNFNASPRHSEIDACQNNSGEFREAAEFCFVFFLPPATHTKTMQNLCIWCSHLPRSNREKKPATISFMSISKRLKKWAYLIAACVRLRAKWMRNKAREKVSDKENAIRSGNSVEHWTALSLFYLSKWWFIESILTIIFSHFESNSVLKNESETHRMKRVSLRVNYWCVCVLALRRYEA